MFVNGKTMVRTRFSPATSGVLHLGSARIALFNYLFAKHYGGSMVLRMYTKDPQVLNSLKWLGIEWEEGPIYQKSRCKHYEEIAEFLIKKGLAYPDSDASPKAGYRSQNRNMHPTQGYAIYDDTGWCVRLRMLDGVISFYDEVKGYNEWDTRKIGDPILIDAKGNASPIFANAIDDAEMGITHIIRNEDFLDKTPIQMYILGVLGYELPIYAHIPPILDGNKKLSKSDCFKFLSSEMVSRLSKIGFSKAETLSREELSPVNISFYESIGYNPHAILNYLNGEELPTPIDKMASNFKIGNIKELNFSTENLLNLNQDHTRNQSNDVLAMESIKFLSNAKLMPVVPSEKEYDKVKRVIDLCRPQIKCYSSILEPTVASFFQDVKYSKEDVKQYLPARIRPFIQSIIGIFEREDDWRSHNIRNDVSCYVRLHKEIIDLDALNALRVAIFGTVRSGPPMYDSMEFMGKSASIDRIRSVLPFVGMYQDDVPY